MHIDCRKEMKKGNNEKKEEKKKKSEKRVVEGERVKSNKIYEWWCTHHFPKCAI